jgi:hypothetical protein
LIIVLVVSGCQPEPKESKLMGEIISKNNITEVFKKLREDKDFTIKDFELFTNGMTRLVTKSTDSLIGKSIKEVISSQVTFERDQMAATAANQANKVELVMNHEFKYIGLKPQQIDDKENKNKKEIDFIVFEVTNKSDKDMSDIQGALQFYNTKNELVKIYPIVASKMLKDGVIKPGETKRIAHPYDHNVENERDETIRKDHANLRPIWICTSIEFKDGSKISVTNTL